MSDHPVVRGRAHRHNYVVRVLIAIDQLGNALTGGYPDETISSRLGKRKIARGGTLRWTDWGGIAKPLDWVLDKLDPGHSIEAIELDEGRDVLDYENERRGKHIRPGGGNRE